MLSGWALSGPSFGARGRERVRVLSGWALSGPGFGARGRGWMGGEGRMSSKVFLALTLTVEPQVLNVQAAASRLFMYTQILSDKSRL